MGVVLPDPPSCLADVSHHEGNRERPRARRLQLVSSQTVAPSLTCNRFAALDDRVDVPRPMESGSLFAGGADVMHIGQSMKMKQWALLSMIQRQTVRTQRVLGRGAVAVRNQMVERWR